MKKQVKHNKKIKKGEKVMVISGNDRGQVGSVLSRTDKTVTVQGVNVRKKHVRKSEQNPQGGIIEFEKAIHLSKVAICIDDEKPRRVRVKYDEAGDRVLVYKEGDTDVTYRPVRKGE